MNGKNLQALKRGAMRTTLGKKVAVEADILLSEAADVVLENLFRLAKLAADHRKSDSVAPKDVRLVLKIGRNKHASEASKKIIQNILKQNQ